MSSFGYLLEIEGLPVALADSVNAPVQWSQTIYPYRFTTPTAAPIRTNILDGTSETAGGTYWALNVSGLISLFLQQRATSIRTRLTADLDAGDGSCTVEDASGFAAAGYLYVGRETIQYTGIVGNTITFAVGGRGKYGSEDADHWQHEAADGGQFPLVYQGPPSLRGRRCWMWRYRLDAPTTKTAVAGGTLEETRWHPDGSFEFTIKSIQQMILDAKALSLPYSRGELLIAPGDEYTKDGLQVRLFDPDYPFAEPGANQRQYAYARITDDKGKQEIFGYFRTEHPVASTTTLVGSTATLLNVNSTGGMLKGDTLEVTNAIPSRMQIAQIVSASQVRITGTMSTPPGAAETVDVISRMRILPPIVRQGADLQVVTNLVAFKTGFQIEEVRYLEGDQVDLFLQLLLSRDGTKTNTDYDIHPVGWGAGMLASMVDVTSFEALRTDARTGPRRYLCTEPLSLWDMARWIARTTLSRIFSTRAGVLTAVPIRPLYPADVADLSLSISNVDEQRLVESESQEACIRNFWEWPIDRPLLDQSKEPEGIIRLQHPDSIDLYGQMALEPLDDPGVTFGSVMQASVMGGAIFGRLAHTSQRLSLDAPYSEAEDLLPGDRVDLTWPHVPDLAGGRGLSAEQFDVEATIPQDDQGTIRLEIEAIFNDRYGLVAPVVMVHDPAFGGGVFEAEPQAVTLFSQDGTEDVDHFQIGDPVILVDVSTLGAGGPLVTASTTIADVNYAALQVELAAKPAWLAAGDIMIPDDWDNWPGMETSAETPPVTDWQGTFVALADETNTPPDLGAGGDEGYRYGS